MLSNLGDQCAVPSLDDGSKESIPLWDSDCLLVLTMKALAVTVSLKTSNDRGLFCSTVDQCRLVFARKRKVLMNFLCQFIVAIKLRQRARWGNYVQGGEPEERWEHGRMVVVKREEDFFCEVRLRPRYELMRIAKCLNIVNWKRMWEYLTLWRQRNLYKWNVRIIWEDLKLP